MTNGEKRRLLVKAAMTAFKRRFPEQAGRPISVSAYRGELDGKTYWQVSFAVRARGMEGVNARFWEDFLDDVGWTSPLIIDVLAKELGGQR